MLPSNRYHLKEPLEINEQNILTGLSFSSPFAPPLSLTLLSHFERRFASALQVRIIYGSLAFRAFLYQS
jgi:hypothetical protein